MYLDRVGCRRKQIDLLHAVNDVESTHWIPCPSKRIRSVPTHAQGKPAAYRRNSRLNPLYRAVARPMRPRRQPCHRRANHRRFAAPCGSGPASHRCRSNPYWPEERLILAETVDTGLPFDLHLEVEVCTHNLYHSVGIHEDTEDSCPATSRRALLSSSMQTR
jgi:hypothetical protein